MNTTGHGLSGQTCAMQMLKAPQKLPTAEAAAHASMPEAHFVGRRYALAEKLLSQHAPGKLLPFMFAHGHAAAACQLLYPPDPAAAGPTPEQRGQQQSPVESAGSAPATTR